MKKVAITMRRGRRKFEITMEFPASIQEAIDLMGEQKAFRWMIQGMIEEVRGFARRHVSKKQCKIIVTKEGPQFAMEL